MSLMMILLLIAGIKALQFDVIVLGYNKRTGLVHVGTFDEDLDAVRYVGQVYPFKNPVLTRAIYDLCDRTQLSVLPYKIDDVWSTPKLMVHAQYLNDDHNDKPTIISFK